MPQKNTYAAIDLGSNSFHMIIAREENGRLQILDRLRETVRLASGLNDEGDISEEVAHIAIDTLQQFGQRLREFSTDHVRCVGTNTLRRIKASAGFIKKAQQALGHEIDIIAGREEARLIYLGTTHSSAPSEGNQLVIDIGGGSTELIIGQQARPHTLESINMGCVTYTKLFFPEGKLTAKAFEQATTKANLQLLAIKQPYKDLGWQHTLGCSGTIKAVETIAQANDWTRTGISLDNIVSIKKALIEAGHIDRVDINALKDNRQPVIAGGIAILEALFQSLGIEHMEVSQSSLREGLLYDLIGRKKREDIRDQTVQALMAQYGVNQAQSKRVSTTVDHLFPQVATTWQLSDEHQQLLKWAACLIEIGLAVAHSKYHVHSEYLLKHSDMPGFSWHEQTFLSVLARLHRNKLSLGVLEDYAQEQQETLFYLACLLRLAVLFNRSRLEEPLPKMELTAGKRRLQITLPKLWLDKNPLTLADLESEIVYIKDLSWNFDLSVNKV